MRLIFFVVVKLVFYDNQKKNQGVKTVDFCFHKMVSNLMIISSSTCTDHFLQNSLRDIAMNTASVCLNGIGGRPLPTLWANDLHLVDPLVTDFAPDIVILEIGINDLSRRGMRFSGLLLTTTFG